MKLKINNYFIEDLNKTKQELSPSVIEDGMNELNVDEFKIKVDEFSIPGIAVLHNQGQQKPTIFWCHGGPHSSFETEELQYIAIKFNSNVIGFDYRGSIINQEKYHNFDLATANSSDFINCVDTDYGGGHMKDLKAVVTFASTAYPLDLNKFIVAGHSFGGYMVSMALTDPQFSAQFKLGIAISGFYDLNGYKEVNCLGDSNDPEIQRKQSPMSFAHNIGQKFIIIHGGAQDYTTLVNYKDTEQFANNLFESKKDVVFINFEDGDHDSTEDLELVVAALNETFSFSYTDENSWDLINLVGDLA